MVDIGKFNLMKIVRSADFGYYLGANTGKTSDDILLPTGNTIDKELSIGDEVNAFIYRDSKDRLVATLKQPLATIGELAYLNVVSVTKIGSFANIGLERDIFIPIKEQNYLLEVGKNYLFYIYLDKTNRLAATTFIDDYLDNDSEFEVGSDLNGIVYGFQTNGTVMVAIDKKYRGVILRNECFFKISPGDSISLRLKKYFEDNKMSLSPRKSPKLERLSLEDTILNYLKENDGFMPFNDKSSPEEIKKVFHQSKNYFKNALGGLMKKGLVIQDKTGTKLK